MTKFSGEKSGLSFLSPTDICTYISERMTPSPTPESILQQMAGIQRLERGTLSVVRQSAAGPCCNFQRWEDGRNVSQYVCAEEVPLVRANLAAYEQCAALMEQYVQLLSTRSREERLAGVKKKRRPPTSSLRKKPKSKRS
jgi:hypothetical protein